RRRVKTSLLHRVSTRKLDDILMLGQKSVKVKRVEVVGTWPRAGRAAGRLAGPGVFAEVYALPSRESGDPRRCYQPELRRPVRFCASRCTSRYAPIGLEGKLVEALFTRRRSYEMLISRDKASEK